MNPDIKARWVAALRSGEYVQGQGALHLKEGQDQFCCLGVLCDLAVKEGVIPPPRWSPTDLRYGYGTRCEPALLPIEVQEWAALDTNGPSVPIPERFLDGTDRESIELAEFNDNGAPFDVIAACIEEGL